MQRKIIWRGILLAILMGVAGCVPAAPQLEAVLPTRTLPALTTATVPPLNDTDVPLNETATTLALTSTEDPSMTSQPVEGPGALEAKLIALAKQDLARRLNLDLKGIELVAIEALNWPDASLGCPRPNRFYAQVLTPGYRINLLAAGEGYSYHTDMDARIILCDPFGPLDIKGTPETRN